MAFHPVTVMYFQFSIEGKELGTKGVVRIPVKGVGEEGRWRGFVVGRRCWARWDGGRGTSFSEADDSRKGVEVMERIGGIIPMAWCEDFLPRRVDWRALARGRGEFPRSIYRMAGCLILSSRDEKMGRELER